MKKNQHAQALLLSRAAILLQLGLVPYVSTNCWVFEDEGLTFFCGEEDYEICFDGEDTPFNQERVDKVLAAMDKAIAQARKAAQNTLNIIENWEA